jgi:sugar lactone lactonase YvrE
VLAIDLSTGLPIGSPHATEAVMFLHSAEGVVYGADPRGGVVWRFEPTMEPVPIVTDRVQPRTVTADTTHVYWAEQSGSVFRIMLAGGVVEPVTTCTDARYLAVDDSHLYCARFLDGNVVRAPKSGGTAVAIAPNGYPIVSMIPDGDTLFIATLKPRPQLFRVPMPDGPSQLVKELLVSGRYEGLAVTSDYFYMTDSDGGVRRIHRVTNEDDRIHVGAFAVRDPVIHGGQLYFAKNDSFVMHCVD